MADQSKQIMDQLKQITIIGGHYGSGKTEFAVNLARRMGESKVNTCLVDLDIVNPYFRSYERGEELEKLGVKLMVSSCGGYADQPALPAEVNTIFFDKEQKSIIDLGGDPVGARVLGFYEPQLNMVKDKEFYLVVNANRPETGDVDKAQLYLESIEFISKQKITGIINNTHLCRETTAEDVLKGEQLALDLAERCQLPVICSVVESRLMGELEGKMRTPVFEIEIMMIKPWEENPFA